MKKFLFLLLIMPSLLYASNNGDSLKFEIIKASIDFLATDFGTFPNSSGNPSKVKYDEYSLLKDYCEQNKIIGASNLIDIWKQKRINSESDLTYLKDEILNKLTTEGDKAKRKKLGSYSKYIKRLDTLISSFESDNIMTSEFSGNDSDENANSSLSEQRGVPIVVIDAEKPQVTKSNGGILSIILLLTSVLALGIGSYSYYLNRFNQNYIKKLQDEYINLSDLIGELKTRISNLKSNELRSFEDKLVAIQTTLAKNEKKAKIEVLEIKEDSKNTPHTPDPPVSKQRTYYAKFPDIAEGGFSGSIFMTGQNGEQIYEIVVNNDSATYSITEDVNAQKYALSDYNYYLSKGCEFSIQPQKNSKIINVEKGILFKSGNDWIIQKKAVIEFK